MAGHNKSKKGRKHGNKKRKPAQVRYVSRDRLSINRAARIRRFNAMVEESRARRAAKRAA